MVGVAHCLEQFILLQSKLIGQQTRDLLALRRAHDGLQESFSALERYLTERAMPMLDEAFACEPAQPIAALDLKPTPKIRTYRQCLPVSTKTLGAAASELVVFVADRVFLVEILMVLFGWIKFCSGRHLGNDRR